jgi:ABC-type transporter Mla MlaB component
MPVKRNRSAHQFQILEGGLDFEIRTMGQEILISLTGTLDADMLLRLKASCSPHLWQRGRQVILDGSRLDHLDYRAVTGLLEWHEYLKSFRHNLLLADWTPYHKTILLLGCRDFANLMPMTRRLAVV